MRSTDLDQILEDTFLEISDSKQNYDPAIQFSEKGIVKNVSAGIATVTGLPGTGFEELLEFPNNLYGMAFNLDEDEIGVVLLGRNDQLQAGDPVLRTHRVADVPVGEDLIGRVIDSLGNPMDDKGPISSQYRYPIERPAPPIMSREAVNEPLQTGIKVIDAIIPIGRGQRELILGDRQTGKTSIAVDTILNQHDKNVLCVYCAIGQRTAAVATVISELQEKGAMAYTVVVFSEGNSSPGLQYLTPYAATSIAEYFMEQGRDVLIVYDDLTKHARAYRELSLLLRRPPGREAFPGDIFYIHSRLLERSTHLNEANGGGSLTALPIIETQAQDISAYIPTNIISITDGQIYLSPKLFELGLLPAVDIGKSVSRVGGKAQLRAYRKIAGNLKLAYAQSEELETFSRFGTRLDADTQKMIERGKRIRMIFKQPEMEPVSVPEQLLVLMALIHGVFDDVPLDKITMAENLIKRKSAQLPDEVLRRIFASEPLEEAEEAAIVALAKDAIASIPEREAHE
ncbi:alternate F1F0 ATPase, F1 subunit alpha [Gelidibacter maritimus]|uniref:ATP synthase subunit alpha n=1 Tax=Gelidibacter maritimus TaxID=2761487 RepID=A0A7W2M297_9FLAO|nr:alternate F1F0 ATPase, F1 subunit alpha [Gelidibacter maritimus]MBA6151402.1 alternate F1F0 ATPase, F1 subunit alpha [Gelidibacter maritimus]